MNDDTRQLYLASIALADYLKSPTDHKLPTAGEFVKAGELVSIIRDRERFHVYRAEPYKGWSNVSGMSMADTNQYETMLVASVVENWHPQQVWVIRGM